MHSRPMMHRTHEQASCAATIPRLPVQVITESMTTEAALKMYPRRQARVVTGRPNKACCVVFDTQ